METNNLDTASFRTVAWECARQILAVILIVAAVVAVCATIVMSASLIAQAWRAAISFITLGKKTILPMYTLTIFLIALCAWAACVMCKLEQRAPAAVGWTLFAATIFTWVLGVMAVNVADYKISGNGAAEGILCLVAFLGPILILVTLASVETNDKASTSL